MSGADLAAVQRIMRHQDPRLTTKVYGHLSANYLKREIERLSFGPPAADETKSVLSAGGASEPPLPADTRADERSAAPFTTRLLPDPPKGHPERVSAANRWEAILADLQLSGREDLNLRPFGPEPNALPGCATPRGICGRQAHAKLKRGESMRRSPAGSRTRRAGIRRPGTGPGWRAGSAVRSGWRVSRWSRARVQRERARVGDQAAARAGAAAGPAARRPPSRRRSAAGAARARTAGSDGRSRRRRACRPPRSVAGEQQGAGVDVGAEAGLVVAGRGLGQRAAGAPGPPAAAGATAVTSTLAVQADQEAVVGAHRVDRQPHDVAGCASRGSGSGWRRAGAWSRAPAAPTACRTPASASTPPTSARRGRWSRPSPAPARAASAPAAARRRPVASTVSACGRGRVTT